MHIGIIGTGSMGSALGQRLAEAGHQIFYGSIEAGEAKSIADMMAPNIQGGSIANAADFGEVIFLAIPWIGVDDIIDEAGELEGRVIIDCTNPFMEGTTDFALEEGSGAEYIAKRASDAQVIKAFNTVFAQNILKAPAFAEDKPSAFYCGDDEAALKITAELAEDIGLEPVHCGELTNARYLEYMAAMLFKLSDMPGRNIDIAYRLIKRPV